MAYLGTPIDTTNQFQSLQGKRFSGNASTTAFTLDVAPSSTLDIEVFVENVRQDPNSAYSLSGTTLTFAAAPPSGTNNIYVVHQAKAVGTIEVLDSAITTAKLGADAVTEAKIADDAVESEHLNDNIISGQTALTSAPADTDEFLVSDAGTLKRIDYSLIKGGGKINQVIQTVSTASATISSTSFADVITAAITPSATSSKILIDFRLGGYNPGDAMDIFFRVLRDSTTLTTGSAGEGTAAMSAGTPNSQRGDGGFSINFLDSPSSTSEITFKLQSKVSGNSYTFNSKSGSYSTISTLTLMEVLV